MGTSKSLEEAKERAGGPPSLLLPIYSHLTQCFDNVNIRRAQTNFTKAPPAQAYAGVVPISESTVPFPFILQHPFTFAQHPKLQADRRLASPALLTIEAETLRPWAAADIVRDTCLLRPV